MTARIRKAWGGNAGESTADCKCQRGRDVPCHSHIIDIDPDNVDVELNGEYLDITAGDVQGQGAAVLRSDLLAAKNTLFVGWTSIRRTTSTGS